MNTVDVLASRRSGILLHITSLPSGTLGDDAYRFVDFLQTAGMTVWQTLPLGPPHGDSPYQCISSHAGNPELICPIWIKNQYWFHSEQWDSEDISQQIAKAYAEFELHATNDEKQAFNEFCALSNYWLDDYVLFVRLRELHESRAWFDWPYAFQQRDEAALTEFKQHNHSELNIKRFEQFIFFQQWQQLKGYANDRGIHLFGDMPIFVAHDSVDVWAEPNLFTLDDKGQVTHVAGVPPDYFSETGQRWGNPLYDWQAHKEQGFDWWHRRMKTQLDCFDLIRIDHFRGFEAYWEIPAHCDTAVEGQWIKAPGEQLFDNLLEHFGSLPLIAEDLGIITEEVTALRKKYGMPGMKILQFAFSDGPHNPYLPHNQCPDSVVYTGTHDNDTSLGWYQSLDYSSKAYLHTYFGDVNETMPWLLIRGAIAAASQLAIIPMQDVLSLDGEHRMNVPGTVEGNWAWRFNWDWLNDDIALRLRHLNDMYGRLH